MDVVNADSPESRWFLELERVIRPLAVTLSNSCFVGICVEDFIFFPFEQSDLFRRNQQKAKMLDDEELLPLVQCFPLPFG